MPRLPIDYSKTIIYKIVSKDVNIKECYVGQTTDFTKRKCQHKSNCNNISSKWYNLHIYQFIREHGGWINFDMIEVEKYNANDILDAHKKERYWIEQLQATLNKLIPSRTIKEYYEQNKDKIKEPITCICGSICSKNHLKRHEQTKKHIEFVKTI